MTGLLVALGAAVGAPLRLLSGRLLDRPHPTYTVHWGTLLANVLGSFLLGALVGAGVDGHPMALLGVGFCGAFTTYSAVAVQAVDRGGLAGAAYALGTVLACLAAAAAGYAIFGG